MKSLIARNPSLIRTSSIGFPGNLSIEYNREIAIVYPVYGKQEQGLALGTPTLFLPDIYAQQVSSHLPTTPLMHLSTLARQRALLPILLFASTVYSREELICKVHAYFWFSS